MKIAIEQPLGFSRKGKRQHNEDAIFPHPDKVTSDNNLYIVCDGVGGTAKGEVASRIVCDEIARYFRENNVEVSDETSIAKAVEQAEVSIDKYLEKHPDARGMGTTLCLLHFHKKGATIAWCGDSRLYQLREKEIIFRTIDHSYVNQLLTAGIITPEEAKDHPDKNVITRAIQGRSVKKVKVDVIVTDDLQQDDQFFLCTDGVLETFDDERLLDLLSKDTYAKSKVDAIDKECDLESRDNYTCYLLKVTRISDVSGQDRYVPTAKPAARSKTRINKGVVLADKKKGSDKQKKRKVSRSNMLYVLIILFSITASLSLLFLYPGSETKDKAEVKPHQEEQARLTAEQKATEQQREKQARLAAEREAEQQRQREENAHLAAEREAEQQRQREEQARLAAEREVEEQRQREEQVRAHAEREAEEQRQRNEQARIAAKREAEEQAWHLAESANTIESYQSYLDAHPNGQYVTQARESKENMKWDKPSGNFKDERDGKTYNWARFLNQVWMAENLSYIPDSENYWAYDEDLHIARSFGYLYDWQTAIEACPPGWKLPSDDDWQELADYFKDNAQREVLPGLDNNDDGTLITEFFAHLGGYRDADGYFHKINEVGYWWSSTESEHGNIRIRTMKANGTELEKRVFSDSMGFSARCVKIP